MNGANYINIYRYFQRDNLRDYPLFCRRKRTQKKKQSRIFMRITAASILMLVSDGVFFFLEGRPGQPARAGLNAAFAGMWVASLLLLLFLIHITLTMVGKKTTISKTAKCAAYAAVVVTIINVMGFVVTQFICRNTKRVVPTNPTAGISADREPCRDHALADTAAFPVQLSGSYPPFMP
jgi:succinate dehydrogenase hydrophobic anchor subunit